MPLLLLSQEDVERLLDAATMLDVLAQGFADLSDAATSSRQGAADCGPRMGFSRPCRDGDAGGPIGVKLVSASREPRPRDARSPGRDLPVRSGDGDATGGHGRNAITALRTAGGAALSARLLARPEMSPRWRSSAAGCRGSPTRI